MSDYNWSPTPYEWDLLDPDYNPDEDPLPFATFDEPHCPECGENERDCTCNGPTRCHCADWRLTVPEGSITCGACGLPLFPPEDESAGNKRATLLPSDKYEDQ